MPVPTLTLRLPIESVPEKDRARFQEAAQSTIAFVEDRPEADDSAILCHAVAALINRGLDAGLLPLLMDFVRRAFWRVEAMQSTEIGHA